ncbi:MAG: hypothetical protein HW412_1181, partial [Bacteroidetes bacterium]|nr:hypothetical protein [Bacteroidota bacterium]
MKKATSLLLLTMIVILFGASTGLSATYIWQGAAGASWAVSTNWLPDRVTPAADDVLQFNAGGTASATAVPTQTIGQLIISNNTAVTLTSATGTLTLSIGQAVAGTDLDVQIGSSLSLANGGTAFTVNYTTGQTGTAGNIAGTVTVNAGVTWDVTTGTTSTTTVSGTVVNANTITGSAATLTFASGGKYQHNFANGGTIPIATWDANSTVEIVGALTGTTQPGGMAGQAFGNFTWNPASQTQAINLSGGLTTVNGFTISNTGVSELRLTATTTMTLAIGGNYNQTGGTFVLTSGTGIPTVNLSGNFSLSGGTLSMTGSASTGNLNIAGDFSHTVGTITETSTGTGIITFNKAGTQTVTSTGTISNTVGFTIGATSTVDLLSDLTVGGNWTNNGTFNAGTSTVTFGGVATQAIAGSSITSLNNLTITNTVAGGITASTNFNVGGTLTVGAGATLIPAAAVVINSGGPVGTITGTGTIHITRTAATADYLNQYKFATNTLAGLILNYSGTGAQTINGLSFAALTISGTGTKTLDGAVTVNGALTLGAGTTLDVDITGNFGLTVAGNWVGGTGAFTPRNGTVTLNGTAQTITGTTTFFNLTLSNSGAKTLTSLATVNGNLTLSGTASGTTAAVLTIAGNLDVGSGTSFTVGNNITVTGTTTLSGTLTHTTTGTTKIFTSDVTISGTGNWNNGANEAISFGGSLLNGGTFTSGTGVHTFTGAAKTFSGTISIPSVTINSPGAYQNDGTLTVATALIGTGSLTQAPGATLNIGGTSTITTLIATASPNLINYNGTGQTVKATSYDNLTISGSGIKLLGGIVGVGGDLTVSAGTLDLSTFTANRATPGGTLILTANTTLRIGGTGTLPSNYSTHSIAASSTIDYFGTTQTVATLNSSQNYGNLLISAAGVKTLAGNIGIAGNLTVNLGTLDLTTFTADRTAGGGTLTLASAATAILKIGGTGTMPVNYTAHSFGALSTVEYSGTTQTVSAEAYGNLTTSGSDTKTLATGTTAILGALTIGLGTTFDAGVNSFNINGNWVNNGNFTSSGGQAVTFSGGNAQSIGGTGTTAFVNLTINKTVATVATAGADLSVASVLNIQSGTFNGGTGRTVTLSGSATPFVVTGVFTAATSTFKYTGATGANVAAATYNNLTLDSPGQTFTAAGNMTVSSVLTVAAGTTFDGSNAIITLPATGTPFLVNGTFTPSTSTISYTSTATAAANVTAVNYYNLSVAGNAGGDTFTALGDITVTNVLTVGLGQFNPVNRTITLSGSGTPLALTGTITTPSTSTFIYTGATGGGVAAATYNNLTLNSSGVGQTFTALGNMTVSNVLTVASGTTFDASTFTHTLSGSGTPLVVNGTFTPSTSTFTYNNATGANVTGGITYNNLTVNSSGDIFTLTGGNAIINGDLAVTAGTLDLSTFTADRATLGGTLTVVNTHTLRIGGTGSLPANFGTHALGATSTVEYNGTNQTVASSTYGHLILSGSGTKSVQGGTVADLTLSGTATANTAGSLTINTTLVVGAGTTFNSAGFDLIVTTTTSVTGTLIHSASSAIKRHTGLVTINAGGVWNNSGDAPIELRGGLTHNGSTFTAGAGIYTFNTTAAQTITGTSPITIP